MYNTNAVSLKEFGEYVNNCRGDHGFTIITHLSVHNIIGPRAHRQLIEIASECMLAAKGATPRRRKGSRSDQGPVQAMRLSHDPQSDRVLKRQTTWWNGREYFWTYGMSRWGGRSGVSCVWRSAIRNADASEVSQSLRSCVSILQLPTEETGATLWTSEARANRKVEPQVSSASGMSRCTEGGVEIQLSQTRNRTCRNDATARPKEKG